MLHFSRLLLQLYLITEVLGLPDTQKNTGLSKGLNVGESNLPTVKFYDSQTQKERNKRDINHLTHNSLKSGDLGEFCVTFFNCTYRNAVCVNNECRCPNGTRPSLWEKACQTITYPTFNVPTLKISTFKPAYDWHWNPEDFCSSNIHCRGLFLDCIGSYCKCRSGYYPDYKAKKCTKSEIRNRESTPDVTFTVIGISLVGSIFFFVIGLLIKMKCYGQSPSPSSYNQRTRMNNFSRLTPMSSANSTPQVSRSWPFSATIFPLTSNAVSPMTSHSTINTIAPLQPGTNDNPPNYFTTSGNTVEDQLPSYDEATKPTASAPNATTTG